MTLSELVSRKVTELGDEAAAQFFGHNLVSVKQWRMGSRAVPAAAMEKLYASLHSTAVPEVFEGNWEGRKVAMLLPWYKQVNPVTSFCLMGLFNPSTMRVFMACQDAFIVHTRNTLARKFLNSPCEWAVMFDNDMVFPFGSSEFFNGITQFDFPEEFSGVRTIHRLMSHGKSLVGGLYFGRNADGQPMFREGISDPDVNALVRKGPQNKLLVTRWVATGCLLIHRTVFEDINKKYPDLGDHWFTPSEADLLEVVKTVRSMLGNGKFSNEEIDRMLAAALEQAQSNSKPGSGEDVTFCIRAGLAGHQPHVDLGLVCGHIGDTVYGPFNTHS
jgi:hypothetical protein